MRRDSFKKAMSILALRDARIRRRGRRGMSLVEVMVVIAIILTLMSVIGYGVMSVFQNSRVDTTKLQMARVAERYAAAEAHYGPAAPHLLAAQMTETANELIFSAQP